MRHLVTLTLGLIVHIALSSVAFAQADLTAEQIIERMLKQDAFGWDEAETTVKMTLVDAKGTRSERVMENVRRQKEGLSQSVVRFRSPQDVAGTAFLMVERAKGENEQHIYLPGLKRTRRIVGREREGSFMGSDFSYADLERSDMRGAKAKRLPDEEISGVKTFVVELTPPKTGGYSKIEMWIRQDNYLPLRNRFYDKAGKLVKTFYTKRIKTMEGRPVIVESEMVNNQTKHSTQLVVDNLRPKKGLPDAMFTPTALEHG